MKVTLGGADRLTVGLSASISAPLRFKVGGKVKSETVARLYNVVFISGSCDRQQSAASAPIRSDGRYSLRVPKGAYRVLVVARGAEDAWHRSANSCRKATVVRVEKARQIDLQVAPVPFSRLTGTVTTSGVPIRSGSVYLTQRCDERADREGRIRNGRYAVRVPKGTYKIRIEPEDQLASWDGGVVDCEQSPRIVVGGNLQRDLTAIPTRVVRGQVSPVQPSSRGTSVSFFYSSCDPYDSVYAKVTDGQYEMRLPFGHLKAQITTYDGAPLAGSDINFSWSSWNGGRGTCPSSDDVVVSQSGDVVNLTAAPASLVTGSLSGAPSGYPWKAGGITFFEGCERVEDDTLSVRAEGQFAYRGSVSSDYLAKVPDGIYRVRIDYDDRIPGLANVTWNGGAQSCKDSVPVLVEGATTLNLSMPELRRISGVVTAGGKRVRSGFLYFLRQCTTDAYIDAVAVGASTISPTGRYSVLVPDGRYRVYLSTGSDASWHSARRSCRAASPVTVSGTRTQNLVASGSRRAG